VALNPQARGTVNCDEVVLDRLPFRVGRESRVGIVHGRVDSLDRRMSALPPSNDLYLLDTSPRLHVSREHFQIERAPDGAYELLDRGSACGCIVDGRPVGGNDHGGRCRLRDGSIVTVGGTSSPYRFLFVVPAEGGEPARA
jgi:hypothetical protein